MPYQFNQTYSSSVIFFDLVGFSKLANDSQSTIKSRFYELLRQSLVGRDSAYRIQMDTGDGAAIAFLSNPEEALHFLIRFSELQSSYPDLRIRTGAHLGPSRVVQDLNDAPNLVGDGINAAQRVMSFAEPGEILVSRAFQDTAKWLSNDHAEWFHHLAKRADKHGREHDLYRFCSRETSIHEPDTPLIPAPKPPLSGRPAVLWLSGALASTVLVIGAWFVMSPSSRQQPDPPPVEQRPPATTAPASQIQREARAEINKVTESPQTPAAPKESRTATPKAVAKPATTPVKNDLPAYVAPCPTCNCAELYAKVSLGVMQPLSATERRFLQQNCK